MSAVLHQHEDPGKWASAVLAVLVHALLALFLFYGVRWQTHAPDVVEVSVVRAIPSAARPTPPRPVPVPITEPEPVREPVEVTRPAKPDIAIKEKEKEKPKAPIKEVPKPAVKPALPTTPTPNKAVEDKAVENKALRDTLRAELKAETAKLEANKAAQELNQLKATQVASALSKVQGAWSDQIRSKIKNKIVRPPNLLGNPEAIYEITLLPDGSLVDEPRLKQSTGNLTLDAAIERAILASSPLPTPTDPAAFQRVLTLKIRPLEE